MRLSRLGWLNLVLWLLLGGIVLAYGTELLWAARTLRVYVRGEAFPPLREHALRNEALQLLRAGGDVERARRLLEASLAIDPNTDAVALLGEVYLHEGDVDSALRQYERYSRIDPANPAPYRRMAEILAGRGDLRGAREVLERGVETLGRAAERWRPRPDPDAPESANNKAEQVYRQRLEGLARLREALAGINPRPGPPPRRP